MDHTNRISLIVLLACLSLNIGSCSSCSATAGTKGDKTGAESGSRTTPREELVFQSGFEGTTRIEPRGTSSDDDITGAEQGVLCSDWDSLKTVGDIRSVYFNYTGGTPEQRRAEIIDDPTKPGNKILRFRIREAYAASENQTKARVQLEFHGIRGGFREFYQSVRVFLPEESFGALRDYPKTIEWLTISEFWNNEWWDPSEKYGFRVTLSVRKPQPGAGKDLYFGLNAEDAGFHEVWNANNEQHKVPIGQWFTMNYYFREGDADTGRFYLTVTPDGEQTRVVFDVHNFTHNSKDPAPNGVTAYNPLKLYTSREVMDYMKSRGKPLEIWWDELKLWKNRRP